MSTAAPLGGAGPTRFARFALPPNLLGYCGPDDHQGLLEYAASGVVDGGLRELVQAFDGAWPYLDVIARAAGIQDPLDDRVVSAYWLGGPLLDGVPIGAAGRSLDERFRARAGTVGWSSMAAAIGPSTRLSHGFHVFGVYPWVGLLRSGSVEHPLHILDRCRIRWGTVLETAGDRAVVSARALIWDGRVLALGDEVIEQVRCGAPGGPPVVAPRAGDVVALHWDWVCEQLTSRSAGWLQRDTAHQLACVNADPARSGPARLLG